MSNLMSSDLYSLNYKQVLVILNSKNMRMDVLKIIKDQEIEVNLKFVDGYIEAAKLINKQLHDPFDNIILNLSISNTKASDFLEFIKLKFPDSENLLIDYNPDGSLVFASSI